uniref:Phosphodiesterase 12 n=1 Tax=Strix occidentalis caurina TaxID=311401 RepID=A0A8D0EH26_STROC
QPAGPHRAPPAALAPGRLPRVPQGERRVRRAAALPLPLVPRAAARGRRRGGGGGGRRRPGLGGGGGRRARLHALQRAGGAAAEAALHARGRSAALWAAPRGGEQRARGGRPRRLHLRLPGAVRAVSYNILADTYAQTEFSRTVLYPYCAPYALELDYRQNLLKKELAGYSADLVCLQEVDKCVFVDSLAPALDAFGLEGLFKIKEKQHEGLATFYRRDKFSLLIPARALLGYCPEGNQIGLQKVLEEILLFEISGNIRLIQIAVALSHIKHVTCDLYPGIPVIFCGDFNSTPSSGTYSFISKRCNMPLSHPFKLLSACGEPAYTNYVGGFHGCLDYIFIDKNALEVEQVIPLPSHEEVTTHQALPSVSHPSDHIALVCDLKQGFLKIGLSYTFLLVFLKD